MSLKEKLIKNSTIKLTASLTDSKIYTKKDSITTSVPMINVALSGSVDGGITPGLTMLAGPSKHFKTGFALLFMAAFLNKYEDGLILFYDSEFGTPQAYFKSYGIDFDKVVHSPITDVEELKFDIMQQLKQLDRKEHVMIVIDSIGNLASKKEVDDAMDGKSVTDMSRAKQIKSLFRMITPHLTLKDIPMVVINHTYKTLEMYSKDVVAGGNGPIYSSDTVFIIGRQQDKDKDKDIRGYHFIINVEKSRYVKEKSKIPITISYENGINRWSGLLEVAIEGGYIVSTKPGSYGLVDKTTGEIGEGQKENVLANNKEFWEKMLVDKDFLAYIKSEYTISHGSILSD